MVRVGGRLAIAAWLLLLVACTGLGPRGTASSASGGEPIGQRATLTPDDLEAALLGEAPYPSGWPEQVDELVADVRRFYDEERLPLVSGMTPVEAACAAWTPLLGHVTYAIGAFVERQFFIAHTDLLAEVAPDEVRAAAEEAHRIAAEAAAEQMRPHGDPGVISTVPADAIRTIGLWAVEHCNLPVVADEPPKADEWTDEQIEESCASDRDRLISAEEEYFAGPGKGRYAVHPHALEVTVFAYPYPLWHRVAAVDNDATPPSFRVEPIPGGFCDR